MPKCIANHDSFYLPSAQGKRERLTYTARRRQATVFPERPRAQPAAGAGGQFPAPRVRCPGRCPAAGAQAGAG